MHEFLLFLTLADATCSIVVTQVTLLRLLQDKEHPRVLIPELCRLFYQLGWVTGTGGGISLKQGFVCNFFFSTYNAEHCEILEMFRLILCCSSVKDISC